MPEYRVTWEIDIEAATPEEAARKALTIQRDANSRATVFNVTDEDGEMEDIDITAIDEEED
jgi:hypothetical protein